MVWIIEDGIGRLRLNNFTWASIGDSFTSPGTYQAEVANRRIVTGFVNLGVSGMTLTTNVHSAGMNSKVALAVGYDLITILGGTNDWYFDIPLTEIETYTRAIITGIRASSPSSNILFILPAYRSRNQAGGQETTPINNLGLTIREYGLKIQEVCVDEGVYYLNLYNADGLMYYDMPTWSDDGLHPNAVGYAAIGKLIGDYLT